MENLIGLCGTLALLLLVGSFLGLINRQKFVLHWLLMAALLVAVNDALLLRVYGIIPHFLGGDWNWQGKIFALGATLAIAALPNFGWGRSGLTFAQHRGSLKAVFPILLLYFMFFLGMASIFPNDKSTGEEIAFQLTMPGIEEEPFYRGILLLAFDRAFTGRKRLLGVEWGWGAILSSLQFGMAHAFGYSDHQFSFDPMTMMLTALPALLIVWVRLRTGSVLLPIIAHNFGNSIFLFI
ncbi:abortive infection bacteriophage protein [Gluconobacter frateurii M-2]|nr:abortive infection bacteriophage protein [Gluconobacter frateurii M-2]